ncbi:MAG: 4-hydroxyphenylacetate 3-hydroxylase N-terminal domain-containing protein [Candidatus Freyarchaeota archaeon]
MYLKTGEEYIQDMIDMNFELYIDGGKISGKSVVNHPKVKPMIRAIAETYDMQHEEKLKDFLLTKSHFTGETISRWTHVAQTVEDLIRKVDITRYANRRIGMCSFRCVHNAFPALLATTKAIDKAKGTHYYKNAVEYIKYFQKNDLIGCPAMTDPKGDRLLKAHEQSDPDMYLRVVEKDKDGIVLRGAKLCQTGSVCAHEKFVAPSTTHYPGSEDYAVCCAVPGNAKGIKNISARYSQDDRRREDLEWDIGNPKYGFHETVVIFDDVFVPWERVFMCGEVEFTGMLVNLLGACHRPSTGGCKTGWSDILIGAVQAYAELNGTANVSHVREKITDMISYNETMYSCGIAACVKATYYEGAGMIPDMILANNTKYVASKAVYELIRLAEDITGGIITTLPSEKEFKNPEIAHYLARFYAGANETPAEHRARIVRLIENLTYGAGALCHSAAHGGGSGQACKITMYYASKGEPLQSRVRDAKRICGIEKEEE